MFSEWSQRGWVKVHSFDSFLGNCVRPWSTQSLLAFSLGSSPYALLIVVEV